MAGTIRRILFAASAIFLFVAGHSLAARAADADLTKICRNDVNDDTVRDYQPAFHDAALKAFKKFFPHAAEKPTDEMLASEAKFRCMSGKIYACFIGANLPCSKMNTQKESVGADAFCKQNPSSDSVPMVATGHDTIYAYRCKGGKAEIARTLYQVDPRGFAQSLWMPINVETPTPQQSPDNAAGDPIQAKLEKCLASDEGQTTKGMTHCTHKAYEAYEDKMDAIFKRVVHAVDDRSAKLIRDAQNRWQAYRKNQAKADNGPWRMDRGSMVSPDIEAMNVDAIRNRIKELSYYLKKSD
jgi:Lysozyme inhibitor LprI